MTQSRVISMLVNLEEERHRQAGDEQRSDSQRHFRENPLGAILKDNLAWILQSDEFTREQKKAAGMIAVCKTQALGGYLEYCPSCDKAVEFHYCSCNNRNCPHCQYPMQEKWIALRKTEVIPGVPQYHIILTCPHELNPLFQTNPRLLSLLLKTSARAVLIMCKTPKVLGAVPSILSVLHTWTSDLQLHYHAHMLVSGGGLDADGKFIRLQDLRRAQKQARNQSGAIGQQEASQPDQSSTGFEGNDYFLSMAALTALFRGTFMAELRKLYSEHKLVIPASLDDLNDPYLWTRFCYDLEQRDWIGDLEKATAEGANVIEYFARYAYRTAISNSRIVSYDGRIVQFTVRDKKAESGKKTIPLDVHTFIRRYLSHVLPKGFTRVRFFGLLSNARKKKNLQAVYDQIDGKKYMPSPLQSLKGIELMKALLPEKEFGICPFCHGDLQPIPFGQAIDQCHFRKKRRKRVA